MLEGLRILGCALWLAVQAILVLAITPFLLPIIAVNKDFGVRWMTNVVTPLADKMIALKDEIEERERKNARSK